MNFYPVYRLCRSNGSFSRIGSLLESCRQWGAPITPHLWKQAMTLFNREPEDRIILGPRCASNGKDGSPDQGG